MTAAALIIILAAALAAAVLPTGRRTPGIIDSLVSLRRSRLA